ncbi:hypothetical protein niasHS_003875 [Heterodera schachtii]|uniref:EGF-like domain-containing protein n=1 Tax=Heterodera schachtii TaxID=97005 RepID=A0ABD2K3H6_HETSC
MIEKNHSSFPLNDQNQNFFIDGVSSRLIYEGSPCDAFPCWNGGTCTENGHKRKWRRRDKAYTCKCRAQFEGEHCEGRKAQENSTGVDWCSTERQTCPTGMICVVSNSADGQCLSIQALSASPTEHLFPLPPLLLTFYGLFLLILLLLFCWAGNSSGFLLLLRKRNKRGQWREATLMGERRSEYEPILEEEEERTAIEFGSGGIEMGKMDYRWAAEGLLKQSHAIFAVDGTHPKALNSDSDLPSIPKIVHI